MIIGCHRVTSTYHTRSYKFVTLLGHSIRLLMREQYLSKPIIRLMLLLGVCVVVYYLTLGEVLGLLFSGA